jgi:hypothetical protein
MMRRGAGFDTKQARRLLLKECQYVATLELTTEDDIALRIDAVNLTWGDSGQGVRFSNASATLQWLFRYPRSEPDCTTWSFPRQINLTFGRRVKRLHQYPACGGGAQEDETILKSGFLGHGSRRFVHLDPPGLIRSWKISRFGQRLSSGGFHHGSLDDDTSGHIFPERYQQLARQRYDGRLLKTTAIAPHPFFEPQSQSRLRLMAQP